MALVRKDHRVDGVRSGAGEPPVAPPTPSVGRGRGALRREKRGIKQLRSHIPQRARQADRIVDLRQRFGWQACVTHAGPKRRSVPEAMLRSRNAYRVARIFQRLKSRGQSAPLCVQLTEPIEGLTSLRTRGVRVRTGTEGVLRRSLEHAQDGLPGLPPENQQKVTDKPTAERIRQAFADVSRTIIPQAAGEEILRRLTPLAGVQEAMLQQLGFGAALYRQLEIQEMGH
jgi:hypothetical protein